MRKEAREWLSKAESDADAAEYNIKGQYYEVAAFLCQQAAEKALKAIYINDFGELVKTHDLHFLGKRTNAPENILDACDALSGLYVESRYPTGYANFSAEKVRAAMECAMKVIEWAKGRK